MNLNRLLLLAISLFAPSSALAFNPRGDVQTVTGNNLVLGFGTGGINDIIVVIIANIMPIIAALGVLVIVRAGLALINSVAEDKLTKARKQIGVALVAIVLAYLSTSFVTIFFGPVGSTGGSIFAPGAAVGILDAETRGLISLIEELLVIAGVIIIIVAGLRVVGSFGKEDGPQMIRQSLFGVVAGFILLISRPVIEGALSLNPSGAEFPGNQIRFAPIAARVITMLQTVLSFMALIAVAVIIYAAIRMIVGIGDDDQFTKSKQLIYRVMIGLFVILMSYAFVTFLLRILQGNGG